jgi:hypothetical protein
VCIPILFEAGGILLAQAQFVKRRARCGAFTPVLDSSPGAKDRLTGLEALAAPSSGANGAQRDVSSEG